MPSSLSHRNLTLTHLGMDVHKDSISIGILRPDEESPDVERIFNDEPSIRRFLARFDEPRQLSTCYEAGPTGYELHRLLTAMNIRCQVIAPSLIPKAPGDRVKTDKRDCRKLARLHRAGELVAIRVPTREEEAVRDLCRARADESCWVLWRLHRLERKMEPCQTPTPPRGGTRRSCVSERCGWSVIRSRTSTVSASG